VISISRLLCDAATAGDGLRYGDRGRGALRNSEGRPVVVWNCTRQCNLNCIHCYASADNERRENEMNTLEGKRFLSDLADFKVPVVLFSGGEPLMRRDLFELAEYGRGLGLRFALSTNGTLITPEVAGKIKELGFSEAGISLDGIGENNDRFRGRKGAFDAALRGIRNCVAQGVRVSLRLTITRYNYQEIPGIFQLVEDEHVDRVCFYHLAYSGRGSNMREQDIGAVETRAVVDLIAEKTLDLYRRGLKKEILTVGNHADGAYLYLRAGVEGNGRAAHIMGLLRTNGGNNTGIKIGAVDDQGNVHPDQFWWHRNLGNVRERDFGDIWTDTSEPLLAGLKDRKPLLKGRCAACRFLDICNGNLRVRAEAVYGDVWASDPACYLTDSEIGVN